MSLPVIAAVTVLTCCCMLGWLKLAGEPWRFALGVALIVAAIPYGVVLALWLLWLMVGAPR